MVICYGSSKKLPRAIKMFTPFVISVEGRLLRSWSSMRSALGTSGPSMVPGSGLLFSISRKRHYGSCLKLLVKSLIQALCVRDRFEESVPWPDFYLFLYCSHERERRE